MTELTLTPKAMTSSIQGTLRLGDEAFLPQSDF